MNRVGHSTSRAAIVYQYAADGRDQKIAAALDKLIKSEQAKKRASCKRSDRKPSTGRVARSGTRAPGLYQDLGLFAAPVLVTRCGHRRSRTADLCFVRAALYR